MAQEYNKLDFEEQLFGFGDWRDSCVTSKDDVAWDTGVTKFYESCTLNTPTIACSVLSDSDADNMSITGEKCYSESSHPFTDFVAQNIFKVEKIKGSRKCHSSDNVLNHPHSPQI